MTAEKLIPALGLDQFTGSDLAFEQVEAMISNWMDNRSGTLEAFVELAMTSECRDLDELLNQFSQR